MFMSPHNLTALLSNALPFPAAHKFNRSLTGAQFAARAAMLNGCAIKLHRLAIERSQRAEVRDYARQMAEAHIWTAEALLTSVQGAHLNVGLDQHPDDRHTRRLDALTLVSSSDFDYDYIDAQNRLYMELIVLSEQYIETGADKTLVFFATNTLSYLSHHLQQFAPVTEASCQ
ncbi:DUF4142 domain-containing protein [Asticcacaulis machinosus]|uniref:DUF4142 domain-containing protein n=1 Tax=Asticcacaulis machinosus TaxID=2984211 RepID=A0ABT5HLR1_9CAUL|nr:DUF4142 domain-containing protein [Asticcacaulis machinosus]MDC7677175.1 DUF4142 domain-containing protein [Asticcacaulis machinosus]